VHCDDAEIYALKGNNVGSVDLAEIDRHLAALGAVPHDCSQLIARYAGADRLSVQDADRALAALGAELPLPPLTAAIVNEAPAESTASSQSGERLVSLPPTAADANGHDRAVTLPGGPGADAWAHPEATERTAAPSDAPAAPGPNADTDTDTNTGTNTEDPGWDEPEFEIEVSGLTNDNESDHGADSLPMAAEVSRPLAPSEVLEAWGPSRPVAASDGWESNEDADALDSWHPDQQLSAASSRPPSGRPSIARVEPVGADPNAWHANEGSAAAWQAHPEASALRSSRPAAAPWGSSQPSAAEHEPANDDSSDAPNPAGTWPLEALHSSGGSSEFKSGLLTQRMDVRELRSSPPSARPTPLPSVGGNGRFGVDELPAFRGTQSGLSSRPAARTGDLPPIPIRSQRPAVPAPEEDLEILVDDELLEVDPDDLLDEGGD
jgi:hypothetical protein